MLVEIDTFKLRNVRESALVSREELHRKSGVSRSTINKLEVSASEERPVRLETAKALAKALGLEARDLVLRVRDSRRELSGSQTS